jgi:hypothetical protein
MDQVKAIFRRSDQIVDLLCTEMLAIARMGWI